MIPILVDLAPIILIALAVTTASVFLYRKRIREDNRPHLEIFRGGEIDPKYWEP